MYLPWDVDSYCGGFEFSRAKYAYDPKNLRFKDFFGGQPTSHQLLPEATVWFQTVTELNANLNSSSGTYADVVNDTTSNNGRYVKSGAYGTGSWALAFKWYETKALMDADLVPDAGVLAIVWADSTLDNNGLYLKSGATGTGSWALSVSSPIFGTHGTYSREGLLMDNTCHWFMPPNMIWEGSMLIIMKPTLVSASVNLYPLLFGDAGTVSSNGNVRLSRASGTNSVVVSGPATTMTKSITGLVSGNIYALMASVSQKDRQLRLSLNGAAVVEQATIAGTTNGNALTMGNGAIAYQKDANIRLGNNSGTAGSVTQNTTDFLSMFECHFYTNPRLLLERPAEVAKLFTELNNKYAF